MSSIFPLIPKPVQMQPLKGNVGLERDASVWFEPGLCDEAGLTADNALNLLNTRCGLELVESPNPSPATIRVQARNAVGDQAEESYQLILDAGLITIEASHAAGAYYSIETLAHLIDHHDNPSDQGRTALPALTLGDQPRFGWRGLMLDVTRHFQPVPTVLRVLDLLGSLKLNRLHLHLCDDEAWRLEIPGYPRLTDIAAWRPGPAGPEGGFYTTDDIAEILAHAKQRNVTVIPEIEMPAHCNAALVAYPELGCDGPIPVNPDGGWDAYTKLAGRRAFCCGQPGVFRFLEDVLRTVNDLFDPPMLHLGGDERPERAWTNCPCCQRAMQEEGVSTTAAMQARFMERMARFCSTQLRKPTAAWSDNLDEGAPPEQVVHAWFPHQAATAARLGHDAINSNHEWTYLDYPANAEGMKTRPSWMKVLPIEQVYHFNPIPDGLEQGLAHHILGSEAAIWTEFLEDEQALMGNLLPRLVAFAEVLWSPAQGRSYDEFQTRLARWTPPHATETPDSKVQETQPDREPVRQ